MGTFEPAVSYRFDDKLTLSGSTAYTEVRVDGTVNTEAFEGALQGAVDNFQLTATLEWRVSRVTAFVFHARYLLFQRVFADGGGTLHPDEFTTVDVEGAVETDAFDVTGAFSVVPSVFFSWGHFNLRFGVGYGNWECPASQLRDPEEDADTRPRAVLCLLNIPPARGGGC